MPIALVEDNTIYYYHLDHLNTPIALTNAQGNPVWRGELEPFGVVTTTNNPKENPLRFPGQYADAATGLYYNDHRDYDPTLGRYLQPDPIGLKGGVNLYTYVFDNPLRWVDPAGLDVTVSFYPGAGGFGHVGIGVNTPNTSGFYPAPDAAQLSVVTGRPVLGVIQSDTRTPIGTIIIPTTPSQDRAIQDFINQREQNPGNYNLNDRNCATMVHDALDAGGINVPETIFPRTLFSNLQQQFVRRP